MLRFISLNMRDLREFYKLNKKRSEFNKLNEDFFEIYGSLGPVKQFLLRKRVTLLKIEDVAIGYIWITKSSSSFYKVSSLFIDEDYALYLDFSRIICSLKINRPLAYSCEKQGNNYELLTSLGFKKVNGTYEMSAFLFKNYSNEVYKDLQFKILEKKCDEGIRCRIQNEVFKNNTRIPLALEDMYYDEEQEYYFENGAVLVKKDNNYIGYGQIIITDNIPTIVNVGILKEYRGMGYGRALMHFLLNILKDYGYNYVCLKVAAENSSALTMYKSLGFNIFKEVYDFEYIKSGLAAFIREP